ncbi:protein kinase domain-containing protein [Lyngbya aestuarii]|uniref:protein kinase domain-containing protein n=1 Tax=Lyngbya aestuarii TaxID=118322 RepID=UPI00403D8D7A
MPSSMLCCLNPNCQNPLNPDQLKLCQSCGTKLVVLLNNRYRLLKPIGSGGCGRTYLAQDTERQNERCVIRQFTAPGEGSEALVESTDLFEKEAKRLEKLGQHPHIPSLLAYFAENNYLYLVQEFIEGRSLFRELQQQGTFRESKIRKLLLDLLNILKFVHQQGVVHRDIKPANILRRSSVDNQGQLVLIDFAIAPELQAMAMAKSGITVGSLGYVPIEQVQNGEAYPASDLFSLGVTCFHLLTGIHPWELWRIQGDSWVSNWWEQVQQSLGTENALSPKLEQILDRLLQEDQQQRYQSAEAILQDLNPQPPAPPQLANTFFSSPESDLPRPQLLSTIIPPTPSTTSLPRLIPTEVPTQISSEVVSPSQTPPQAVATVKQKIKSKSKKPWLLGGAVLLLGLLGIYGYRQFTTDGNSGLFGWWPQKTSSSPTTLSSANISNTKTLEDHKDYVYALAISPDGKTLVSGAGDKSIKIWSLPSGEPQNTFTGHSGEVYALAMSQDGETIVSGSYDNTIRIWNLKTGELKKTLTGHKSDVFSVAISPDGKTIASGSNDKTIKIWDVDTGEEKRTLTGHDSFVYSVAISPDGETVVSGSNDNTIKIWNLKTGELKKTLTGHKDWVRAVAISPDGETLVSGSSDDTIKLWNLKIGTLRRTLNGHKDWVRTLAISSDGETLVSGSDDDTIKIWNLSTGELKNTLTGHTGYVISLAISPDKKTIVSGSRDKTIKIWSIP